MGDEESFSHVPGGKGSYNCESYRTHRRGSWINVTFPDKKKWGADKGEETVRLVRIR